MANNIFDQWDKAFDTEALQKDIAEAAQNGTGDFPEIPHGNYEVSVEKMELKATKKDNSPMVSIWFKIVEGEFKNQLIFFNQKITEGFQIHICNEFLRDMLAHCTDAPTVGFKTYSQYANLLMDIHEAIADNFEYCLIYGQNSKGYNTFEIEEIYDLED